MAINKIYQSEFTDVRDNVWRVDIYKNPQGTIAVKQFVCADPGFTLSWQGAEDVFTPLIASTCTVPFIVENADDDAFVAALFTMDEGEYILEIVRDPDGDADLHWRGFLTSDNLQIFDQVRPYVIELQAVDGLQTLSRRDHPETGNHSLADIIVDALGTIPTAERFTDSEPFLRYGIDYEPQGLPTYNGDPFREMKVAVTTLDPLTGEAGDTPTAEDSLLQMLTLHNSRLFQVDGVWSIQPITRLLDGLSTVPFNAVSKTGAVATGGTFVLPKYLESGSKKLVGEWGIQFLPPLRRITRELNYLGNRPLCGVEFPGFDVTSRINNQTTPATPPTFTTVLDTDFPVGEKFTFRARVTMEQDPVSAQAANPLVRYRLQFTVKVGSYYLGRNHDLGTDTTTVGAANFNVGNSDQTIVRPESPGGVFWSTDSATRVQMIGDILNADLENGLAAGGTDQCEMELSIESPPLPASTDVDCEVTVRAYGFNQTGGGVAAAIADAADIFCDPQLFVGTGSDSDVIKFGATASNGASEEMAIEPSSMYGESGNANDAFPSIYFGSIVGPGGALPTGYQSSLTTSTELVNNLLCLDRLQHFQTAQELRTGSAYTDDVLSPMNFLSFDSKTWVVLNMQHTAKSSQYRLELVKIAATSGPTSDALNKRNRTIFPPRTLAGGQDSLRREFYVNTASLQADIETETSARQALTLSSLTDVNPGTPSQGDILVYNDTDDEWRSAANSSANNSLSETDQTLQGDRTVDLDGNVLTIDDGSTDIFKVSTHNGVQVFGDFTVDSGAVAGASIKLEEADLLGQNFIELKAPISVTADTTLTLPDGAGTSGQVLSTNGSGTLSWVTRIAETNPLVKGALTIERVTAGNVPRLYIKGEDNNAGVFLQAPEAIATDVTFELPETDGDDGDVLKTDGSGVMSFEKPKSYHIIASSFYASDGNGDYIPIGGTLSETTSSNYYTIWTAPCAGRVVKATAIVSATTAGASTLTVRKYPIPQTFASASHTFTATLTTGTFDFGASATFDAGDRLQFRFDPTGRPNGTQISILLELTHE